MGETALDEDIFNEYIEEMREVYTADKVGSFVISYACISLLTLPTSSTTF